MSCVSRLSGSVSRRQRLIRLVEFWLLLLVVERLGCLGVDVTSPASEEDQNDSDDRQQNTECDTGYYDERDQKTLVYLANYTFGELIETYARLQFSLTVTEFFLNYEVRYLNEERIVKVSFKK